MNRWALALVALLGGAVGLLHADYVVIKINLAVAKDKDESFVDGFRKYADV